MNDNDEQTNDEEKVTKEDKETIEDLSKENNRLLDILKRSQADLVNYRNRMKMELSEIETRGKKTVSLKVLSVIDEFDLAFLNLELKLIKKEPILKKSVIDTI